MLNPFLSSPDVALQNERELLNSIVVENIQVGGVDVRYIKREQINLDQVFGESTVNEFKTGFVIEMKPENITSFNGDNDIFSKFGIQQNDEAELHVSKTRFRDEAIIAGVSPIPVAGDLIYMPLSNTLWQIRHIKKDPDYFAYGGMYVYRIVVGLYSPNQDNIEDFEPSELDQQVTTDVQALDVIFSITDKIDETEVLKGDLADDVPSEFNSDNPFGDY